MKLASLRRVSLGIVWLSLVQAALFFSAQSCRQSEALPAQAHGVTYVLEWTHDKVREASQGGWEITNDLGFVVRVTRAYVVSRSIELIPCNPLPPIASLRESIDWVISPRPAFAGHSAIADPSATKTATVESLLPLQPQKLATLYPGAQTYCQAHYLIARADPQASGLPTDVDMVDQSLRFEGAFQRPGSATFEPFSIATAVANGKLFELAAHIDTGSQSPVVVVRRNLDALFDRVDFATMPEKRMAREMLQNLIDGAAIEVRVSGDAR